MFSPTINPQRLLNDLMTMAQLTEPNTPGWTRRFPSVAYVRGIQHLRDCMMAEGLQISQDAVGNLFGRREGRENLPPIFVGSHSDTVMGAGRYDGMLGVFGALEAARSLREAGIQLRHPLVVVNYLSEEATDYAVACLGSLAAIGNFKAEWFERKVGDVTLRQAITDCGGDPEKLGTPSLKKGDIAAHLELHIEQGPILEASGVTLGAVDGINGIRRALIELRGKANHAGTWPMNLRHDALAAAGHMLVAMETICRSEPRAVGTIGKLDVNPNQGNVIPGAVSLMSEIRHLDMSTLDRLWDQFIAASQQACDARGVTMQVATTTRMESVVAPQWLHEIVLSVCRSLDPKTMVISSGAGHDTSYIAQIAPAAMIFVPSVDGRSHCPEEETKLEDLARGAQALTEAIVAVDKVI